jgi:hypothetical protein
MTAIQLSNRLLIAVTTLSDYRPYVAALANLSRKQLHIDLCTLPARKAFLINIYNAFAQVLIREQHPDLTAYITRYKFFSRTAILIAGENLSLNDIEHGLLRHSSVWWSFEYLKRFLRVNLKNLCGYLLITEFIFALNCGGVSCPAIAFYKPGNIHIQIG